MENASKALIIAGAILLAIVIISLGLIVVNNVRSTVDNASLNEQEILAFNSKFTSYEGENVSGSRVNSLLQQVMATNQVSIKEGKKHFITIGYKPTNYNRTDGIYVHDVYVYLGVNNDEIKWLAAGKTSIFNTDGSLKSGNTVKGNDSALSNVFGSAGKTLGNNDIENPSLSVLNGKTYTVKIVTYIEGVVKFIIIKPND